MTSAMSKSALSASAATLSLSAKVYSATTSVLEEPGTMMRLRLMNGERVSARALRMKEAGLHFRRRDLRYDLTVSSSM